MKGVLDGKVREAVVWEEIGAVLFSEFECIVYVDSKQGLSVGI